MQQAATIAQRRFTSPSLDVYDSVEWQVTDALITNYSDGSTSFEAKGVEFPTGWSSNAINIVAQKYFKSGETSLRQLIDRVAGTIATWGQEDGYFVDQEEHDVFLAELKWLLLQQRMAFNSPVWFNIGVPDVPQQASACFILDVEDDMPSILEWCKEEGLIFLGGSGSGVNLSKIRGSMEKLRGGNGVASGPVSFMRAADSVAGTIKSGGKTRRAAKMVQLDIDHPDIEDFIACKAREEGKIRALTAAGYDMGLNGADLTSVQFQNANNSVRVTDAFMWAVMEDEDWQLTARVTGETVKTVRARDLMRQIAQAAWECADPGIMFHDTINRMHTMPSKGEIVASNPCGEYNHLVNSACNLASINLLKYLDDSGGFAVKDFLHTVRITVLAQDILVDRASYPTEKIGRNARAQRQLGIGYANLGALLMARGDPYDSDEGRLVTSAITSLMTAEAYHTSVLLAERLGAFEGYHEDAPAVQQVMQEHRLASEALRSEDADTTEMIALAHSLWGQAMRSSAAYGVRNAQLSLLAPTGTISFFMDCDTTGGEPAFRLVFEKTLSGGGTMQIVHQGVPRALTRLGYDAEHRAEIMAYLEEHHTVVGAPRLKAEHEAVFHCSDDISPLGHIKMMAAMQPFLSGAISKTVNLPGDVTVDEVLDLYTQAWQLGIKALAIYRDGCKSAQPHKAKTQTAGQAPDLLARALPTPPQPIREELPRERASRTVRFHVGEAKGYVTVGEYDDGRLGEVFVKMAKQGSTLAGLLDAHAADLSIALQHGVPLVSLLRPLVGMSFEPAGMTDDPQIRFAKSIWDYIGKWLTLRYLTAEERDEMGVYSREERLVQTEQAEHQDEPVRRPVTSSHAPMCNPCGVLMQRAGACHCCPSCGTTDGCS